MNAIRIHSLGGPDVLRYEEVPTPTPGPGQALVKIEAAGVNYVDVYHRTGLYKQSLPRTLGTEAAGVVTAVGPDVRDVSVGERVAYQGVSGAYAEYAVVPADRLVPLPDGISAKEGAAAMLQGMTAQYLACATYPLQAGDTCLVHAAAGGVGLLLVQIAKKIRGARVIGTVSTEAKAELARAAGADEVILYSREEFAPAVERLTGGVGVQVVYDSVGINTFFQGLDCLALRGMMVLYGQSSGPVGPIDPQLLAQKGSLFLTRPSLQHYVATRAELLERAGQVFDWIRDGLLTLRIGHEFPLSQAAEAHRQLEGRATTGKVLLIPDHA
ncbi:MAG TPA: quinone oxidoreductase [Gemmatimonadaceae bacterium]